VLGWIKFWWKSITAAFGFGWVIFGTLTTASPTLFGLIERYYPYLVEKNQWVRQIVDNQNEIQIGIAAACVLTYLAYAPYKLYAQLEKQLTSIKAEHPDFSYSQEGSEISKSVEHRGDTGRPVVHTNYYLRFTNRGTVKAYNPSTQIFGCWINDISPKPFSIKRAESVGAVGPNQHLHRSMVTHHPATTDGDPPLLNKDLVVFLVEIEWQLTASEGRIERNDPIWLCWYWATDKRLALPTPSEVAVAQKYINEFKNRPREE
jgi:hypothetical protein